MKGKIFYLNYLILSTYSIEYRDRMLLARPFCLVTHPTHPGSLYFREIRYTRSSRIHIMLSKVDHIVLIIYMVEI